MTLHFLPYILRDRINFCLYYANLQNKIEWIWQMSCVDLKKWGGGGFRAIFFL